MDTASFKAILNCVQVVNNFGAEIPTPPPPAPFTKSKAELVCVLFSDWGISKTTL